MICEVANIVSSNLLDDLSGSLKNSPKLFKAFLKTISMIFILWKLSGFRWCAVICIFQVKIKSILFSTLRKVTGVFEPPTPVYKVLAREKKDCGPFMKICEQNINKSSKFSNIRTKKYFKNYKCTFVSNLCWNKLNVWIIRI